MLFWVAVREVVGATIGSLVLISIREVLGATVGCCVAWVLFGCCFGCCQGCVHVA